MKWLVRFLFYTDATRRQFEDGRWEEIVEAPNRYEAYRMVIDYHAKFGQFVRVLPRSTRSATAKDLEVL